ncbi:UDP-N-acetylglucosamine--N-acetylmuramyl-(pentapeptide) pyrophosphoryl-undecaprenol N-acetylglucosamine transferase [candidate division WOR-3 bacterium]|nr:UDP-N-acetylglucosamine--N-acetylmuramyl-(pentapeptide) pyrophosphoryl-undecaprenol N-acetylglucosamine transferase [candidate division WOR-3 bacterium]
MKVIIATGGTGGHIFTGLAIAEELKELGGEVLIVGSKFGLETSLVPNYGYRLKLTSQKPLLGKGVLRKLEFPFFLFISFIQSLIILIDEKPRVVVGTGGFGSFSFVAIAALFGIPTLITEIDSIPGLATRVLSRLRRVAEVHIAFKVAKKRLPGKKVTITGFPIRREIMKVTKSLKDFGLSTKNPTIFIFGGSQGAHSINEAFVKAYELLPSNFQFIWQTGTHFSLLPKESRSGLLRNGATSSEVPINRDSERGHFPLRGPRTLTSSVESRARSSREGRGEPLRGEGRGEPLRGEGRGEGRGEPLPNIYIQDFIQDMGSAYGNSCLVVSRAGALTIGEITTLGIPAILIPYPHATQNHQLLNAQILKREGAASIILDNPSADGLNPTILTNEIEKIIKDPVLQRKMSKAAKKLGTPKAAKIIALRALQVGSRK